MISLRQRALLRTHRLRVKCFGQKAWFGDGGIEYVAFIGLRGDEQLRVARVEARSSNPHANKGYEGETHLYAADKNEYKQRGCLIHSGNNKDGT